MATSFAPLSISGGSNLKAQEHVFIKSNSFGTKSNLTVQRKSVSSGTNRKVSICAQYNDGSRGGGSDLVAGFLLGGAIFGTLGYIFAPQIRRALRNEDEYGNSRAERPIYYDGAVNDEEDLGKTRDILNAKINQLTSAIDKVSSRLRGGKKSPRVLVDPEVEATM